MKRIRDFNQFKNLNEGLLYQDNKNLVDIYGQGKISKTEWNVTNWITKNFCDINKLCSDIAQKYKDKKEYEGLNLKIVWKSERLQQVEGEPTLEDIKFIVLYTFQKTHEGKGMINGKYDGDELKEKVIASWSVNDFKKEISLQS